MSGKASGKAGWWSKLGLWAAFGTIAVEKSVEWLFDKSLLSEVWSGLKGLWFSLLSDIPMPAGLVLGLVVICLFLMGSALYFIVLYSRAFDELEAWRNPPTPRLSNIEHDVVMTVAGFWDNERSPDERDIRLHLNLTPIAVHAALDGLVSWQLIEPVGNRWDGFAIGLTPKGRAYVQHPDSLARRNRRLG
jgi:hypothetical protein